MRSTVLLLMVGLAGCLEPEDDQVQWMEDFEGCGLCDWWQASGSATLVTTDHPGEHAAQLEAGTVLRHPLGIRRPLAGDGGTDPGELEDGNWLEYSTDCAGRPSLELRAFTEGELDVVLALTGPSEPGFTRRHLTLPALPTAAMVGAPAVTLRELVLTSGSRCRIDNLRLMVSGGSLGYY